MSESTTSRQLQTCLDRLRGGDPSAHDELWELVDGRLTALTRKIFRNGARGLRQWEQTDDLAQNAKLRLIRALGDVTPATAREFYGLASLQVRRELIDRIRSLTGRDGKRVPPLPLNVGGDAPPVDPPAPSQDPGQLVMWQEFHEAADRLPAPEREVFELHWYQDLPLEEVAQLLGVDRSTVKRRWRNARLALAAVLPGDSLLEG